MREKVGNYQGNQKYEDHWANHVCKFAILGAHLCIALFKVVAGDAYRRDDEKLRENHHQRSKPMENSEPKGVAYYHRHRVGTARAEIGAL